MFSTSTSFLLGLVIRPKSLDIVYNRSDPVKYVQYVRHLDAFLQSEYQISPGFIGVHWDVLSFTLVLAIC